MEHYLCQNNVSVFIYSTSQMGTLSTLLFPQTTTTKLDANIFQPLYSSSEFQLSCRRFCLFEESVITLFNSIIEPNVLDNGCNKQGSQSCFQSGKLLKNTHVILSKFLNTHSPRQFTVNKNKHVQTAGEDAMSGVWIRDFVYALPVCLSSPCLQEARNLMQAKVSEKRKGKSKRRERVNERWFIE